MAEAAICDSSNQIDNSEVPGQISPKDALAEGLIGILRPAVEEVDERVRAVRWGASSVYSVYLTH